MASNTTAKKKVLLASAFTDSPSEISRITGVPISTVCKYLKNNSDTVKEYRDMRDQVDTLQIKDAIEEISDNTGGENIMQNNYGFVKLCYGVVGSYKDTSNMTTDEVIKEFLKHEGVSSAEEYFDKTKNNTYGRLKQEVLTKQTKYDKIEHNTGVDVYVDELTPCLRRLKDNKIVDTEVFEIKPTKKEFSNWEFDWTVPVKHGYSVYAIKAKGDERIQGLVALKRDERNFAYHVDIAEAAPFNNPHHKSFVEKEYDGIGGHLFAEAVRKSYEAGFGGVVFFTAKTNLIEHYEKELGANLIDYRSRRMFINERAAKVLYDKYYGGNL